MLINKEITYRFFLPLLLAVLFLLTACEEKDTLKVVGTGQREDHRAIIDYTNNGSFDIYWTNTRSNAELNIRIFISEDNRFSRDDRMIYEKNICFDELFCSHDPDVKVSCQIDNTNVNCDSQNFSEAIDSVSTTPRDANIIVRSCVVPSFLDFISFRISDCDRGGENCSCENDKERVRFY